MVELFQDEAKDVPSDSGFQLVTQFAPAALEGSHRSAVEVSLLTRFVEITEITPLLPSSSTTDNTKTNTRGLLRFVLNIRAS
jgi:hypothetical protein